jgi:hypothetical protein
LSWERARPGLFAAYYARSRAGTLRWGQPGGAEGFSPVWVDTELVQDIPLRDAG